MQHRDSTTPLTYPTAYNSAPHALLKADDFFSSWQACNLRRNFELSAKSEFSFPCLQQSSSSAVLVIQSVSSLSYTSSSLQFMGPECPVQLTRYPELKPVHNSALHVIPPQHSVYDVTVCPATAGCVQLRNTICFPLCLHKEPRVNFPNHVCSVVC
jgi:hypothetical protein